jgi:hypothetical protein
VKAGDSLLTSFVKFSNMLRDLYSTGLLQFNSDTENCVPDGFQELSQMNKSRRSERNVTDWLNELAADCYDVGIFKLVQRLDKLMNRHGD